MSHFIKDAATGFKNADAYDAYRPSYRPEIVNGILKNLGLAGKKNGRIVDVAAGTGKFTELLAARKEQFDVVAVEPVQSMRTTLDKKKLGVKIQDGLATSLGLPDAWADGITVAQAFHWFDNIDALTEMHRVLKPGGKLALVWNVEDCMSLFELQGNWTRSQLSDNQPSSWTPATEWEKSIKDKILQLADMGPNRFRHDKWQHVFELQAKSQRPLFTTPIESVAAPFKLWLTPEALWDRINTLSQVSILEGAQREAFVDTFNKAMRQGDGEWNESGEIAFHGHTYYAWTSRL